MECRHLSKVNGIAEVVCTYHPSLVYSPDCERCALAVEVVVDLIEDGEDQAVLAWEGRESER